jgi:hypothetical protein
MNLYFIYQDEINDYETYNKAVVCAPNEEVARNIHPSNIDYRGEFVSEYWCSSADKVNMKLLGEAVVGSKIGVVLASYGTGW